MALIDNWVLEFFLRRQQNPTLYATSLFSSLKPNDSVNLKITAVLRDLSNSLNRGKVNEEMLDLLEVLEKLQEGSVIMGSLKSAYCWIAVECTVMFMWPVTVSEGLLSDALERIWEKRIGVLKERKSCLVTRELLKWESDLNKAVYEPEMYQKIRETNIRYIAISYLNQFLKEQWALLGCSSLESEARRWLFKRKKPNGDKNPVDVDVDDNVNEQEEEHEASHDKGDIRVARELKDCLMEIQGVLESSTRQGQGTNNAIDVSRKRDRANRTEIGGGQGDNGGEDPGSSSSGRRVRPHLPTPKPLDVSLLKQVKPPRPRRPTKFWTPEEEEALREGVKKYGKAWKHIKNLNPDVLADRTEVDLKDKWRNFIGRDK
ncbi:hypothetical protein AALP_AA3G018600 [Arabis alpina]|uniref:Uncharacterized protein n=1 Tax=Arabis alpina TaxID=50452 RepID=A0A087H6F5_ARAAL|nr:hypothetical protein AALP_AA3G018600 [Arabis alpina]